MIKDWSGGYYVLFNIKTIVPGYRPIVYDSYKYNSWKVLSFITIEQSGRKMLYSLFI